MKSPIPLTAHMLVKNEQNWIWFAINSILDFVDQIIIYDTGSTDNTIHIIQHLKKTVSPELSKKIILVKKRIKDRNSISQLRQAMVQKTQTSWFMLVDGDEVWSERSLKKLGQSLLKVNKDTVALYVRTRNCVGDVFHYQPESAGHYHLGDSIGHFNIRVYKKLSDYSWRGNYPNEAYTDKAGLKVNQNSQALVFVDTYYYHLTHLKRSDEISSSQVIDRVNKFKYEIGIKVADDELPEIFYQPYPKIVSNPFVSYSPIEKVYAHLVTPLKKLKRTLFHT